MPHILHSVPGPSPARTPSPGQQSGVDAGVAAPSPVCVDLAGDPGWLRSFCWTAQPRCPGLGQLPSSQAAEGAGGPGIGSTGQAAGSAGSVGALRAGRLSQPRVVGTNPAPSRLTPAGQQEVSPACRLSLQSRGDIPPSRFQTCHPCGHRALPQTPPELVLNPASRLSGAQPSCFILGGQANSLWLNQAVSFVPAMSG